MGVAFGAKTPTALCTISGPAGTPFSGGVFRVDVTFPELYPSALPDVYMITRTLHPNVPSQEMHGPKCRIRFGAIIKSPGRQWGPTCGLIVRDRDIDSDLDCDCDCDCDCDLDCDIDSDSDGDIGSDGDIDRDLDSDCGIDSDSDSDCGIDSDRDSDIGSDGDIDRDCDRRDCDRG